MTEITTPPEDLGAISAHNSDVTPRPTRPALAAPLRLKTSEQTLDQQHQSTEPGPNSDNHPTSAQPPLLGPNTSSSPKTERLPSFRHISKIADSAGEDSRPSTYPPPPPPVYPPPTAANQSPVLPHHPYPAATSANHSYGYPLQPSPSSAITDPFYPTSPPSATFSAPGNVYNPRRPSFPISAGPQPPPLNSMPTGSSSGESYTQTSSVGEGQSTSQTTPIESAGPIDNTGRPKFPLPPPNMTGGVPPNSTAAGPWYCEHPGCTASPFPTQYLLNSHATSHSQSRPHYCPIPGCPRGEGGKGFKRKNEMIRHGLTHDTPGYVCPFCPDRGHRYPRPDNLQRHVRVHHIDKDRDDPMLREVLSQRAGGMSGGGRGRRRRTGP
ncbi:Zinc finger C2H2 type domain-containing protein 9 [Elsinoe fawcettii]|nr:Zinc finger C2H2 type domain-containing protein 9 [Elsinoe fawcettii]